MLGKVTFDKQVNGLERYCKGDISYTFKNLIGYLSKIKGPRCNFVQCIHMFQMKINNSTAYHTFLDKF